jgi:hypothetical protein
VLGVRALGLAVVDRLADGIGANSVGGVKSSLIVKVTGIELVSEGLQGSPDGSLGSSEVVGICLGLLLIGIAEGRGLDKPGVLGDAVDMVSHALVGDTAQVLHHSHEVLLGGDLRELEVILSEGLLVGESKRGGSDS